jgi:hypothetical protein
MRYCDWGWAAPRHRESHVLVRMSIGSLAREIGVDPDEMLVRLWDSGFDQFDEPSDSLGGAELKQVLRALGLPGYKDLRSSGQWLDRLGVPAERVQKILAAAGLRWRRGMRVLPVGAPWALHEFEAQTADTDAPERGAHLTCEQPAQSFPEPVGQSVEWPAIGTVRDPVRYLTVLFWSRLCRDPRRHSTGNPSTPPLRWRRRRSFTVWC